MILNEQHILTKKMKTLLFDAPYFPPLSYDGRTHMQTVCRRVQTKHCAFHHYLEDVTAVVKEQYNKFIFLKSQRYKSYYINV